ncbi:MAG: hypothetical protein ACRDKX_09175, partial [Solirubrobacterales bacterium]
MIVEAVRVGECARGLERRARVRWRDGDFDLRVAGPAELTDETPDASGFLAAALPLAMRLGEDLELEGPVSPALLEHTDTIQRIYSAWLPGVRRIEIEAPAATPGEPAGDGFAAFFSRGVDSTFSVGRDRAGARALTSLVFVDGFDTGHDEDVRAEEIRRAGAVAERIGLPLAVAETNLRDLANPLFPDWEDFGGAAMGFIAAAIAAGFRRVLIAPNDSYATLEPAGTSPLLDPLFSTERVQIDHDLLTHTRVEKLAWLAAERPDLLELLKVCYMENRPDNCGRCPKCLLTMTGLQAAGALHLASEFPDAIDLDAFESRAIRRRFFSRFQWLTACRALGITGADGALRRRILEWIRETALTGPGHRSEHGSAWVEPAGIRDHRLNAMLSLLLDGRPYPPLDDAPPVDPPLGLVRAVDRARDRHVYAVGRLPDAELVGELGA